MGELTLLRTGGASGTITLAEPVAPWILLTPQVGAI